VKSDEREAYHNGYIVQNIDCTPGSEYVEFNQGRLLELGQEAGGLADDIMKAQVYETVEQHLKKERAQGQGHQGALALLHRPCRQLPHLQ
jgi:type III restriction enzyme